MKERAMDTQIKKERRNRRKTEMDEPRIENEGN